MKWKTWFCALSLVISQIGFGWGRDGHRIVARIAELYLTQRAYNNLEKVLKSVKPTHEFKDAKHVTHTIQGVASLLSQDEVTSWPDLIRPEPEHPRPTDELGRRTGEWHFINVPIATLINQFKIATWCKAGNCVTVKMADLTAGLAAKKEKFDYKSDTGEPIEIDAEQAVKFDVHLHGDDFQPLHAADYDHDEGGNSRRVVWLGHNSHTYDGKPEAFKLHSVWDTTMVDELMYRRGKKQWWEYADYLKKVIDEKNPQKDTWVKSAHPGMTREESWTWDSLQYAKTVAYNPRWIIKDKIADAKKPFDSPASNLDETYFQAAARVIDIQLMRSGYTLTNILNEIYDRE